MTPAIVAAIDQTLPLLSNAASNALPQEGKGGAPPVAGAEMPKDGAKIPVDTVSISAQSRLVQKDVKKNESTSEEAKKKAPEKERSVLADKGEKSDRSIAKVQFVYNLKGELSVRYLDTANNLVYQVPSELMLQMREAAAKSEASVDTKA